MRNSGIFAAVVFCASCFLFAELCPADSFTHSTTGEVLHGYPTGQIEDGKRIVYTVQRGMSKLNLSEWTVSVNRLGRKDKVVIIPFGSALDLAIVVEALENSVKQAGETGPILIVLEIDSPGGKAEYVERLCDVIIRTDYCPIVAFVRSGRYGGAMSGASAVALACDKICMASNTAIGAASLVLANRVAADDKLSIAWEKYLESLAQRRNRPGFLARAMVDKDIAVVEVMRQGNRRFIDAKNVETNDVVVRRWVEAGSLLTLTAAEAVQCGIAEFIAEGRAALLRKLDAATAEVVIKDDAAEAERKFKKIRLKFSRLRRVLDANIKKLKLTENIQQALTLLREVREQYESLLFLARRYRDLYLDVELIEQQLNVAESYYEKAKDKKRGLDANSVKREQVED